jgi:hypothetical protein
VVSLVGAPALTSQKAYIDAAVASGVKRFIPSEFGCDTQAPYLYFELHMCGLLTKSAGELIFQAKRDTAAYLKELAAAGKITYTLVITGNPPSRGIIDCKVSSSITRCLTPLQESISRKARPSSPAPERNSSRSPPELTLDATLPPFSNTPTSRKTRLSALVAIPRQPTTLSRNTRRNWARNLTFHIARPRRLILLLKRVSRVVMWEPIFPTASRSSPELGYPPPL